MLLRITSRYNILNNPKNLAFVAPTYLIVGVYYLHADRQGSSPVGKPATRGCSVVIPAIYFNFDCE
jgi:hypothetical protein